tara:strand:- start:16 stop:279 length:264 start_codon:yes stop_codon:yes gene_type:complete
LVFTQNRLARVINPNFLPLNLNELLSTNLKIDSLGSGLKNKVVFLAAYFDTISKLAFSRIKKLKNFLIIDIIMDISGKVKTFSTQFR